MAELKATIRISTTKDGVQFEVDDARGEPYAMGSNADTASAMHFAEAYVENLVLEVPLPDIKTTAEEYAAEVSRARAEFEKSYVPPRSGVR